MEQLVRLVPTWCWWLIALVLVAGGQQYRVGKSNFKDNHLAGLNGELEGFQFEVRSGARSVMPTRRS